VSPSAASGSGGALVAVKKWKSRNALQSKSSSQINSPKENINREQR
jgi:hypothetical protein